jgi:hypothetical protein
MTEIERLQDAKRRALAIADERAKENVRLRAERNALIECLRSIAEMKTSEPREPDDADWRFRCLEAVDVAKRVLADVSTPPGSGK